MSPLRYTVRLAVARPQVDTWRAWMVDQHLPDVLGTGCFSSVELVEDLDDSDPDARQFRVEWTCPDEASFARYEAEHAEAMRADHSARFGAFVRATRSLGRVTHRA